MPRTKQNENLKKGKATQFQTGEKQVEIARQGGIASGIAKRKKKTLAAMAQTFSELPVPNKVQKELEELGVSKEDAIHQMALVAAMFSAGEKGNVRAAALITEWLAPEKTEENNGVLGDILDAVRGVDND